MATPDACRTPHTCTCPLCRKHPHGDIGRQHAALNQLLALSDERTRRLVAAAVAHQYGRGGIARLAVITGLSRTTIRRGLWELGHPQALEPGRIRQPGGGRPRLEKKVLTSSPRWRGCCATSRRETRSRV